MILQVGGHHGHSHGGVMSSSPHSDSRTDEVGFRMADGSDMMTMTTRTTSANESRNINVKAAFIHTIGDLLQSFGVLVAAYIIFYKVALWCSAAN